MHCHTTDTGLHASIPTILIFLLSEARSLFAFWLASLKTIKLRFSAYTDIYLFLLLVSGKKITRHKLHKSIEIALLF